MGTNYEFNPMLVFKGKGNPGWGVCVKDGFRIYPIGQPIPLIQDGKCISIVEVWKQEHVKEDGKPQTTVRYNVIYNFHNPPGMNPVSIYFEQLYYQCNKNAEKNGADPDAG